MGGHKSQSTTPNRLNAIQVNQSAYGNCVPLLYGTSRLPITLIDYVDFKATSVSQSSGGKGGGSQTTTSYTYSASIVALICEGPVTGINQVYLNSSLTSLANQKLQLFLGAGSQPVWSYMTTYHPDHALPYDHMAYVAGANYSLGSQAGLPNLTFEVQGLLLWQGGPDAHPAQIIPDYCSEPNHGVNFPFLASLGGPNSFQSYCTAMGFFISPTETTQRSAQDFVAEILQVTNSNAVWSPATGLRIVPYADSAVSGNGDSYTPNLNPIYAFFDSDYIYTKGKSPVQLSIKPANETFNVWRVEFLDRANQYNTAIAEFRDEVDVAQNGLRVASTVSLHSITTRQVAITVAALLCFRNLYIRSTFKFSVRMDYSLLEPMDLVAINDSTAGIVNQLVRITDIDDSADDVLTITAEEMLVGPASAPQYDTQLAQAYAANYQADPGSVAAPYIFTAPPLLIGPNGGYEMWIATAGTTGLWGGADVYASLDNVTYDHVGIITNPARYGTITGALPIANDPDTSDVLTVQLNNSIPMTMVSGTRAGADNLRTLSIVDGEVIAYQNVSPLGNNAFSLSYLRRGNYGTPIGAHAAGSFFAIIDGALFRMPFDPGMVGQPVWFKFVSFNYFGGGRQDISKVPAYLATFRGQNGGQLLPSGSVPLIARNACVNVGARIYKNPTGVNAWDSDCFSKDAFAGACTVRFTASQTNAHFVMGLAVNPQTTLNANGQVISAIDYCWYPSADGNAYIFEHAGLVFSTGPYTTSTKFEIVYDGKYVTYYRDSVHWRSVPAPGLVLFLDSAFYTPGGAADNVYFGALNPANSSPFIARGQCVVSGENIHKAGGIQRWDSDVYSLEGYPKCHVTWKANDNTTSFFMVGLTTKPAQNNLPDNAFATINFALYCAGNQGGTGRLIVYENGVNVLDLGAGQYDTTTVFAITYDGATVSYLVNNVVKKTTLASGLTLFMDAAFYNPDSGCNTLQFGPTTNLKLADTSQLGLNAASGYLGVTTPTGSASNIGASGTTDILLGDLVTTGLPVGVDFSTQFTATMLQSNGGVNGLSAFTVQLGRVLTVPGFSTSTGTMIGVPFDLLSWVTSLPLFAAHTFQGQQLLTFSVNDTPAASPPVSQLYFMRISWTSTGSVSPSGSWAYNGFSLKIREYKR